METPVNIAISAEDVERIKNLKNLKVERFRTGVHSRGGFGLTNSPRRVKLYASIPRQTAMCRTTGSTDHLVITGQNYYHQETRITCTFLSLDQVKKIEAFIDTLNQIHQSEDGVARSGFD